ncbi:uncharacterized protein [Arachis hypogaea]|uniref:uncharacterized protein isoform X2 n=1 Tax=Arachis hypogaea TaxID=3818 RepID=UPI003B21B90B
MAPFCLCLWVLHVAGVLCRWEPTLELPKLVLCSLLKRVLIHFLFHGIDEVESLAAAKKAAISGSDPSDSIRENHYEGEKELNHTNCEDQILESKNHQFVKMMKNIFAIVIYQSVFFMIRYGYDLDSSYVILKYLSLFDF